MDDRTAQWLLDQQRARDRLVTAGTHGLTARRLTHVQEAITGLEALRDRIAAYPLASPGPSASVAALYHHVGQALHVLQAQCRQTFRRMDPGDLPAGVTTQRRDTPQGLRFEFRHDIYGLLGHIQLIPLDVNRLALRAEIARQAAPQAAARQLFDTIIQTVLQSLQPWDPERG